MSCVSALKIQSLWWKIWINCRITGSSGLLRSIPMERTLKLMFPITEGLWKHLRNCRDCRNQCSVLEIWPDIHHWKVQSWFSYWKVWGNGIRTAWIHFRLYNKFHWFVSEGIEEFPRSPWGYNWGTSGDWWKFCKDCQWIRHSDENLCWGNIAWPVRFRFIRMHDPAGAGKGYWK